MSLSFNNKTIVIYSVIVLVLSTKVVFSQSLSSDFHKERREELRAMMPKNSVAVFFSNPIRNRSNDVDYVYHQDPNFYYLTGWKEPDAVLLVYSNMQKDSTGTYNEKIYVREKNAYDELWNGKRLGIEGATKMKFDRIEGKDNFITNTPDFSSFTQILFFEFYNDIRDNKKDSSDLYDLVERFRESISISNELYNKELNRTLPVTENVNTKTLHKLMGKLREVKTPEESILLKKAIAISTVGQIEVMKAMQPNMSEREIQGIHEFVYRKYGVGHEGYPSIVGAGHNGCILHYIDNDLKDVNKHLVLMDLGAEYEGYTADVTRTIPSTGTFTEEERIIYEIVYKAQEAGIKAAVIGATHRDIDKAARKVISEELLKLGIISYEKENRKYFPHGTSHHIGLDVHDLSNYDKFTENMFVTVEPGIYIPQNSLCDPKWWGIAIRIEDDILITKDGAINLSADAPRKWDEIEEMMKQPSPLSKFELPDIKIN